MLIIVKLCIKNNIRLYSNRIALIKKNTVFNKIDPDFMNTLHVFCIILYGIYDNCNYSSFTVFTYYLNFNYLIKIESYMKTPLFLAVYFQSKKSSNREKCKKHAVNNYNYYF